MKHPPPRPTTTRTCTRTQLLHPNQVPTTLHAHQHYHNLPLPAPARPGLANPGPIAAALWTDEEVEARVHLDSVVTVVDALNINRQLHEPRASGAINEAQLQIAYADLVVLNKVCGACFLLFVVL